MVWIHGGANFYGGTLQEVFDGESLTRRGVVLVSLNYRLGSFGFFAHQALTRESRYHASGNQGLLNAPLTLQQAEKRGETLAAGWKIPGDASLKDFAPSLRSRHSERADPDYLKEATPRQRCQQPDPESCDPGPGSHSAASYEEVGDSARVGWEAGTISGTGCTPRPELLRFGTARFPELF